MVFLQHKPEDKSFNVSILVPTSRETCIIETLKKHSSRKKKLWEVLIEKDYSQHIVDVLFDKGRRFKYN